MTEPEFAGTGAAEDSGVEVSPELPADLNVNGGDPIDPEPQDEEDTGGNP